MKRIYLIGLLVCVPLTSFGQIVEIPDDGEAKAVLSLSYDPYQRGYKIDCLTGGLRLYSYKSYSGPYAAPYVEAGYLSNLNEGNSQNVSDTLRSLVIAGGFRVQIPIFSGRLLILNPDIRAGTGVLSKETNYWRYSIENAFKFKITDDVFKVNGFDIDLELIGGFGNLYSFSKKGKWYLSLGVIAPINKLF